MASSRDPKIIRISHGEHEVSPHLTSLAGDELALSNRFFTDGTSRQNADKKNDARSAPIEINLLTGMPTPRHAAKQVISRPVIQRTAHEQRKQTPPKPREIKRKKSPLAAWFATRATVAFLVLALAIVTPLKAITTFERLQEAKSGVEQLTAQVPKTMGADISAVGTHITAALTTFHSANASLQKISAAEEFVLRNTPVFGEQFGVASRMVAAGEHMSMAAASYMQLFVTLKERASEPLLERLSIFFEGNRAVLTELTAAAELVEPIDVSALPEEQRLFVAEARTAILALHNDAQYLASAGPVILSMLGNNTPRRYLIIFQNPAELRPTGGFIGSFALVDIEHGEIKNLQIPAGGSYDLQGTLKKHVFAPLPLHIINSRWEFQDANWFPDFPTSARKLMWFLEKSQGPSVDGVIAINASVLPDLLHVVGSVKLASGSELNAETALETVRDTIDSAKISDSAHTKSKPKEIIANAAPAVIETIKAGKAEHFLPLITVLLKSLENRDVQLFARDSDMQRQISEFGWDGAMRDNPAGDFLSVIATNIGGQKTDARITQKIDHQAKISDDGTVNVTVRINRTQTESGRNFEGGPNISYVRFYVPAGSTLVTADGFSAPSERMFNAPDAWEKEDEDLKKTETEVGFHGASGTRITDEFGHRAFGNWMITTPGSSVDAVVSYTLPFKVQPQTPSAILKVVNALSAQTRAANYSLFVQRQSGSPATTLTSRVILPDAWRLGWITDSSAHVAENGALLSVPFLTDLYYGLTAHTYASHTDTKKKN